MDEKKNILSYSNLSTTIQHYEMIKTCISFIMISLKLYQTLLHTRYMHDHSADIKQQYRKINMLLSV
jgi:hypothetical protein